MQFTPFGVEVRIDDIYRTLYSRIEMILILLVIVVDVAERNESLVTYSSSKNPAVSSYLTLVIVISVLLCCYLSDGKYQSESKFTDKFENPYAITDVVPSVSIITPILTGVICKTFPRTSSKNL